MKIDSTSKKAMLSSCVIIIAAVLVFSAIYLPLSLKNGEAWNIDNMTHENRIEVPELFSIDGALQGKNVVELNKYLFNSATVPTTLSSNLTATDIRNSTNNGKGANQSIVVNLGGLKWTVMYVSQAKTGDVIATLWLTSSNQLPVIGSDNNSPPSGESTFGDNLSNDGVNDSTSNYPTNMYGTSCIRAWPLNNGGRYLKIINDTENPTSLYGDAKQNQTHIFAPFTMWNASSYAGIVEYIVKPINVSWQELGQTAKTYTEIGYNLSNENWSTSMPDTGFYSGYNWAKKSNYDTWKNDNLWLPSLSETGYNSTYTGIWATNQNERSNDSTSSWLRSAHYNDSTRSFYLNADGKSYGFVGVGTRLAVRPAIHFNLSCSVSRASVRIISENTAAGTISGTSPYFAQLGEKYYANANTLRVGDATFTANPNPGYTFDGWYVDDRKITRTSANPATITEDLAITARFTPQWLNLVVSGTTSSVEYDAKIDFENHSAKVIIYPNSGHFVSTISFDNAQFFEIGQTEQVLGNVACALKVTCFASEATNVIALDFQYITIRNFPTNMINVYLKMVQSAYDGLVVSSGGGGVSGVAVGSTLGGMAYIVGDDYENLENSDEIVLMAKISQPDYQFVGWYYADNKKCLSTEMTASFAKSLVYNRQIIAVFELINNADVNGDTSV